MSIDKLQQQFKLRITYTYFPLHPDTPEEGISLEDLFRGKNIDIRSAQTRLKELMEREGLDYGNRSRTYNSRLAQELGKWAETQQAGETIHKVLYRAYFVDNINLAKIDNLVSLAVSANLEGQEAKTVLEKRLYSDAVDKDWESCYRRGVTAVPTYVCEGQRLIGAQSFENLETFVVSAGAERN